MQLFGELKANSTAGFVSALTAILTHVID